MSDNRTVLVPFSTRLRRFAFGAVVTPADDLRPLTRESLFLSGHLTSAGGVLEEGQVKAVEQFVETAKPTRRAGPRRRT